MLFCKHTVWSLLNSPEPRISLTVFIGVNVDRSLNLTVRSDRLKAVLCKVDKKQKRFLCLASRRSLIQEQRLMFKDD